MACTRRFAALAGADANQYGTSTPAAQASFRRIKDYVDEEEMNESRRVTTI